MSAYVPRRHLRVCYNPRKGTCRVSVDYLVDPGAFFASVGDALAAGQFPPYDIRSLEGLDVADVVQVRWRSHRAHWRGIVRCKRRGWGDFPPGYTFITLEAPMGDKFSDMSPIRSHVTFFPPPAETAAAGVVVRIQCVTMRGEMSGGVIRAVMVREQGIGRPKSPKEDSTQIVWEGLSGRDALGTETWMRMEHVPMWVLEAVLRRALSSGSVQAMAVRSAVDF